MSRYAQLPDFIREALQSIEPSEGGLTYYPCRVTLKDGRVGDNVYIQSEKLYLRHWGVYPEDDKNKRFVRIEDVLKVEESPIRLPAGFANQVYRFGESGMGYTIFSVVFSDGDKRTYATGGAADFIRYPEGKGPADVVAVEDGGRRNDVISSPGWCWCLYSEAEV